MNDGSTDKSLAICKKYQQKDKRITVISKKNEGSIPIRRKGVEAAKSKYVMFVDADDMVNGYLIQEEVIDEYYYDTTEKITMELVLCN